MWVNEKQMHFYIYYFKLYTVNSIVVVQPNQFSKLYNEYLTLKPSFLFAWQKEILEGISRVTNAEANGHHVFILP